MTDEHGGRQGNEFAWWVEMDADDPDPLVQTAAAVQRVEPGKKVYMIFIHGQDHFYSSTWHIDYARSQTAMLNRAANEWVRDVREGKL